jgi:hypothetical protein
MKICHSALQISQLLTAYNADEEQAEDEKNGMKECYKMSKISRT